MSRSIVIGLTVGIIFLIAVASGLMMFGPGPSVIRNPGGDHGSGDCTNNANPLFAADVTDMSKVRHIVPPVTVQNGDLKTHGYLFTTGRVPVYAPTDGTLVEGAYYSEEGVGQYLLLFEASCEVTYMFDHIKEPIAAIAANFSATPGQDSRTTRVANPVAIKAGELLGYTTGTSHGVWDFGVYNTAKQNPFNDPNSPHKESLRYAHAVCPFEYFPATKKTAYFNLFRNQDGTALSNPQNLCK